MVNYNKVYYKAYLPGNLTVFSVINYIQLASYPRSGRKWIMEILYAATDVQNNIIIGSGSRWFREILCVATGFPYNVAIGVHKKNRHPSDATTIKINNKYYKFFKSHGQLYNDINVTTVIYPYRHPLACFVSALNYFYHRKRKKIFLNKKLKSVEQIYKDGEMSYYFDDYLENAGSNYFPFIGSLSNYFNHTSYWQKIKHYNKIDIYTIKYEKMLENPVAEFLPFADKVLNISEEKLFKAIKIAERKTKKDGKIIWRKKLDSYMHFLTNKQISQFNKKYKTQLETLGY